MCTHERPYFFLTSNQIVCWCRDCKMVIHSEYIDKLFPSVDNEILRVPCKCYVCWKNITIGTSIIQWDENQPKFKCNGDCIVKPKKIVNYSVMIWDYTISSESPITIETKKQLMNKINKITWNCE